MILALVAAASLTVFSGETWAFRVDHGTPVHAHRVAAGAKPGRDQVVVAVRAMMGTTLIVTNGSTINYTYRAELIGAGSSIAPKLCKLPANGQPVFESWPQKATAVRLSDFKAAPAGGSCP